MTSKGVREVERFEVVSDDGKYKTVLVVKQDLIDAGHQGDPNAQIPGLKTVATVDGYACNVESDDSFRIVPLDIVVHRR